MVLVAVTAPDEVPVPTNSSTCGVDAPAATATAACATDGGVCRCDADQFDEPHPVEMITASRPAATMKERDTRTRWVRQKCTKTPPRRLLPFAGHTGAVFGIWILTF